jgi:hypothetical protein
MEYKVLKHNKFYISRIVLLMFIIMYGCKDNTTSTEQPKPEIDYGTYDISTYMPLTIGNRWIYEWDVVAEKAVLDRRITDSLRVSNRLLMFSYYEDVLVNSPVANLFTVGYYGHRGGTIYVVDSRGPQSQPLHPLLASPIVVNHTWWTDAWGQRDTLMIISVASGTFNNKSVDTIVTVRRWHEDLEDTTWYARGIGILTEVSYGYESKRRLRSFEPIP